MYIRYTQPPGDLYDWYEEYLQDEEEIDVKAGGGHTMTIGQMLNQWLTKLDWFSTLFPRIPVPIQKQIQSKLEDYAREYGTTVQDMMGVEVGAANNKHRDNNRRQDEKGGGGPGRGNYETNNRYQRNAGEERGGGRGGGFAGQRDRDGYNSGSSGANRHTEDKYQKSSRNSPGSRSRSPARSKHYHEKGGGGGGGGSRDYRRRSPSGDDRYDSYSSSKRGGDRAEDYNYDRDRDSYRTSSSSHQRRY